VKALSLKPRFAAAVVDGTKRREYRTWATSFRGRLAVHVRLPVGAIVGTVEVTGCVWDEAAGCHAWRTHPVNHVSLTDRLGWWTVPLLVRSRQALVLVATRLPAANLLSA
jgi:hypothetical protein